jgi:hypothetical protein
VALEDGDWCIQGRRPAEKRDPVEDLPANLAEPRADDDDGAAVMFCSECAAREFDADA